MFSLRDLRFVLCSRDLDVLCAQRIIDFYVNYPQNNEVRIYDRTECDGAAHARVCFSDRLFRTVLVKT